MNSSTKTVTQGEMTGFTIIELLVVLGIISALAALTFGVIFSTRQRSQQTLCSSNLKQLAIAVQLYAHDNDDFIPPYNSKFGEVCSNGVLC